MPLTNQLWQGDPSRAWNQWQRLVLTNHASLSWKEAPKFTVIWPFSFLKLLFWEEALSSPFSDQPVGRQKFLDMAGSALGSALPSGRRCLQCCRENTPTTKKKRSQVPTGRKLRGGYISCCFSQPVWISNYTWGKWSWHSNEFEKDTVAPRNRLFPLRQRTLLLLFYTVRLSIQTKR